MLTGRRVVGVTRAILAPWTPHAGDQFEVLHTSIFGNFFLVDRLGRVSLLDSWSGQILGVSPSHDSYKASVGGDAEFFRSWFLTDLAGILATGGLNRSPGQVVAPLLATARGRQQQRHPLGTDVVGRASMEPERRARKQVAQVVRGHRERPEKLVVGHARTLPREHGRGCGRHKLPDGPGGLPASRPDHD